MYIAYEFSGCLLFGDMLVSLFIQFLRKRRELWIVFCLVEDSQKRRAGNPEVWELLQRVAELQLEKGDIVISSGGRLRSYLSHVMSFGCLTYISPPFPILEVILRSKLGTANFNLKAT